MPLECINEIIDAHSHIYRYSKGELEELTKTESPYRIIGVGEDLETSRIIIELSDRYKDKLIPCIGLHPWNINGFHELDDILSLAISEQIDCIGEIGLDKKFVEETFTRQTQVFKRFLEYAKENNNVLNIHAAGAWKDVFELLIKNDIGRAMFHWYTGPINLIKDIEYAGYYVSINAAIIVQEKSRIIASSVPENIMLLESDGPYNYRGLRLNSKHILEAAEIVGKLKEMSAEEVIKRSNENARRLFKIP
ncbi:MAG: TatD family hydrolase [Desulfurococcales archaeon]|nr:TatD family hydrolase [Desulfurococcales archaeon]